MWDILSETAQSGPWPVAGLATPFNNVIPEAAFLFGRKIGDYLNEAAEKWAHYQAITIITRGNNDILRQADIEPQTKLQKWFSEEASVGVKKRFGKYLSFEKWR